MLVLLFLFSSAFCSFKELKKFGSAEIIPDTKVYLDITSFNTGDVISFEFKMDLFFAHYEEQERYIFQIGQVFASSYADYSCWENLPNVTNRNVSKDGDFSDDYIFSWDEIKQEGKNYIFIICPEPFDDFYTFWGNKIKIKNIGGNGSSANVAVIVVIIIVVIIVIVIIIIIVVYCIKKRRYQNVSKSVPYNAQIQQQYQQPISYQQQDVIIQQNVVQQPYPYQQQISYQPNVVQPINQPQINYGQQDFQQQPYPQIIDPNQIGLEPAPPKINQQKDKNYSSSKMGAYSSPEINKGYTSSSPQSNEFRRLN